MTDQNNDALVARYAERVVELTKARDLWRSLLVEVVGETIAERMYAQASQ